MLAGLGVTGLTLAWPGDQAWAVPTGVVAAAPVERETAPVYEPVSLVRESGDQCPDAELALRVTADRIVAGDALAADEAALVAAFLIEQCGWGEGLVLAVAAGEA